MHVARELEAQILRFNELTGVYPTFIDGHNHAHIATKSITNAVVSVCQRYPSIKRVRLPLQISSCKNPFYGIVSDCARDATSTFTNHFEIVPKFVGLHLMGDALTVDGFDQALANTVDGSSPVYSALKSRLL